MPKPRGDSKQCKDGSQSLSSVWAPVWMRSSPVSRDLGWEGAWMCPSGQVGDGTTSTDFQTRKGTLPLKPSLQQLQILLSIFSQL